MSFMTGSHCAVPRQTDVHGEAVQARNLHQIAAALRLFRTAAGAALQRRNRGEDDICLAVLRGQAALCRPQQ